MMRYIGRFLPAVCLLLAGFTVQGQQKEEIKARTFLRLLNGERFAQASAMTSAAFRQQADTAALKKAWEGLETHFGAYERLGSSSVLRRDSLTAVLINTLFKKNRVEIQVAFDRSGKVVGFHTLKVASRETVQAESDSAGGFRQVPDSLVFSDGTLKGTLMLPKDSMPVPVALIIAGSGPTDRNGNNENGLHTDTYKLLAEGLAAKGVATLRYDKRYVGQSSHFDLQVPPRFEAYVTDAIAWIQQLGKDPRFSKVILIGHSEGALIGTIAAQEPGVAAFISIAGAGRPLDDILRTQLEQAKVLQPDFPLEDAGRILDSLKQGRAVRDVPVALQDLFAPGVQPFLISDFRYDPAVQLKRVAVPVLLINGTHDIQVPASEAQLLSQADPQATLRLIEGMNHVLKDAPADRAQNIATYGRADLPLSAGLLPSITAFLQQHHILP
ncbi:alpha/beta fold hydrolase [Compostibacter hankyongensis]|uniref:Alpha/beta fold hydrolase n=1 Tax=Compostibacter hankyongensis TaxID=1007089 RepID=A0ABP8FF52_9BACT